MELLFKIIFRSWTKNKVSIAISTVSLTVGLACSVLLIGFVLNEFRIARSVNDSERWFLLQEQSRFYDTPVINNSTGQGDAAVVIKRYFAEVEDYCVCHEMNVSIVDGDKREYLKQIYGVTSRFVDLFRPRVMAGNLKAALSDPAGIAVTKSFAMKRFGKEYPLGETINFQKTEMVNNEHGISQEWRDKAYTVLAVVDDGVRGFLNYDILVGLPEAEIDPAIQGWTNTYTSFLKLHDKKAVQELEKKVNADTSFRERYNVWSSYQFLPMDEAYFSKGRQSIIVVRDKPILYVAGSVAIVILLISCFNYINISMTRSLQRLRNTGLQMVFGATRMQMRSQLIVETALQVMVAFALALLLIWSVLPAFNTFMTSQLTLSGIFGGFSWWIWLLLLIIVTFGPSLYIFTKLGCGRLNDILKQGKCRRPALVTSMVVAQFAISVILIVLVMGIRQQMDYVAHVRPESEQIFTIETEEDDDRVLWTAFKERLPEIPEITDYTSGTMLMSGAIWSGGISAMMAEADARFITFFGIELLEGRNFQDDEQQQDAILVNEAFVKRMGITNPIGYTIEINGKQTIVGVVRDFIVDDFSKEIQPMIINHSYADWKDGWSVSVKTKKGVTRGTMLKLQAMWEKISPNGSRLKFLTMAQAYRDIHRGEQRVMQMVEIFSWISLLLTALGLFGLAWYSVESRAKEIGLHKVNGATQGQAVWLLCRRFMKWITFALLIGLPIAFYLIWQWRMQFVYRADLTAWIFIAAAAIIVVVGMATVIWQSWKAARVNPVDVIKRE